MLTDMNRMYIGFKTTYETFTEAYVGIVISQTLLTKIVAMLQ